MPQHNVKVIGVTGHQNIPEQALPFLKSEIKKIISEYDNIECVTSLAVGADQLLTNYILSEGGMLHAVIPCDNYEETFNDEASLGKYNYYLAKASIIEKMPYDKPSEDAFYDAGCRVADLSDILIAIWDGKKANGKGGTADIVSYAKNTGKMVTILWPDGVSR